jgi:hypothetical protein
MPAKHGNCGWLFVPISYHLFSDPKTKVHFMASTGHLWDNFEWRLPFKLHIEENVAVRFFYFFFFVEIQLISYVIKLFKKIPSATNHSPCVCEWILSIVWGIKTSNEAIKCTLRTGWRLQPQLSKIGSHPIIAVQHGCREALSASHLHLATSFNTRNCL